MAFATREQARLSTEFIFLFHFSSWQTVNNELRRSQAIFHPAKYWFTHAHMISAERTKESCAYFLQLQEGDDTALQSGISSRYVRNKW